MDLGMLLVAIFWQVPSSKQLVLSHNQLQSSSEMMLGNSKEW